jgi:hypothetical protein
MTRIKGRSKYLSNASKVKNSKRTIYKHENSHVPKDSSLRKGSSMRDQINLYWEKRNKQREKYVQSNTKRKIQREEDRSKRSSKSDV